MQAASYRCSNWKYDRSNDLRDVLFNIHGPIIDATEANIITPLLKNVARYLRYWFPMRASGYCKLNKYRFPGGFADARNRGRLRSLSAPRPSQGSGRRGNCFAELGERSQGRPPRAHSCCPFVNELIDDRRRSRQTSKAAFLNWKL